MQVYRGLYRHAMPGKKGTSMVEKDPRLSHQILRVLRLFTGDPTLSLAGSDIAKETGMLSGTIYPILMRLEKAGWLSSQWENLDPRDAGRPRRRLYRLTGLGYNKSQAAFAALGVPNGRIAWNS
jgi:PadR family transcriptional regulator, regulatory protein PadR